ncbi:MAG: bifunctional oligoribonuclease/PAP phosphatase NrnA [Sedimentisphaerales bacterium]|nr:bifunctional oligoribonuclease/PAP phosphatase NrnA [Sedimentisphaerales bacterium]
MVTETDFQQAIQLIEQANYVLMTCHTRPDGDAVGSMRAMVDVLAGLGKTVQPLLLSPLAPWYEFLFETPLPVLTDDIPLEQFHNGRFETCDLVMIIDTNSYVQLPEFDRWLRETHKKVLVVDHHITGDNLGDVELIDTEAAAAGEIIFDLIKHAGWPMTNRIAEALFVALSTDSGWFKFANADARLYRNAAELVEAGANPAIIYQKLYQNFSPARMQLMVRMLQSMELHHNGRVAVQHILRSDFDRAGATGRDTENLIDECQRIGSVEVAVLFVELGEDQSRGHSGFRCSLRSKGHVDVRSIAQRYGGGGHKMASGVNMEGDLDQVKKTILDAIAEQMRDLDSVSKS